MRYRASTALACALSAGALGACGSSGPHGSLDNVKIERALATSVLARRAIVTRVACPLQIPAQSGHRFDCTALLDVGSFVLRVTETNDSGGISWTAAPFALLQMSGVQRAITLAVLSQRHVNSTVHCPTTVLQQQGLSFHCRALVASGSARVRKGSYPFKVTETDALGHVTFIGE